jgi:hypothetical protein
MPRTPLREKTTYGYSSDNFYKTFDLDRPNKYNFALLNTIFTNTNIVLYTALV